MLRWKSSLRIVPCNITFKPDANGRNIVGQQLPTLFDVARCIRLHTLFMLLRVEVSCCAKFETGQTFSYMQTDVTTPVGSCWPTMLRPFAPGFRLRSHGTGRFSTGWKIGPDTSFHMEPFNIFSLFTRNCRTRLNFNFCQRFYHLPMRRELLKQSKMASPSWVTTHLCNRVFTVQKASRPQCSYLPFKFSTVQVKNLTWILAFKFLNGVAFKYSYGFRSSVWTEHLSVGIFDQLKIPPVLSERSLNLLLFFPHFTVQIQLSLNIIIRRRLSF